MQHPAVLEPPALSFLRHVFLRPLLQALPQAVQSQRMVVALAIMLTLVLDLHSETAALNMGGAAPRTVTVVLDAILCSVRAQAQYPCRAALLHRHLLCLRLLPSRPRW